MTDDAAGSARLANRAHAAMTRRTLLETAGISIGGLLGLTGGCASRHSESVARTNAEQASRPTIVAVRGPIDAGDLGRTLVHEHVMCDFIGAERTGRHRYDSREVFEVMRPYLDALVPLGVKSFVDCTPMFIGRDPELLARLSEATGLNIITNTGLYKPPFLPPDALTASPEEPAERWIREFEQGIEGTGIRPGFIKIAVNPGALEPVQTVIVRAACRTCRATGMVIACHTGQGQAAAQVADILVQEGVPLDNFIFVHADSEPDPKHHRAIAERGAWVEFDAIRQTSQEQSLERVQRMIEQGFIDRLLISQDSGWYNVGEVRGGEPAGRIRGYTYLFEKFLPLLRESGLSQSDVDTLVIHNPARALALDFDRRANLR